MEGDFMKLRRSLKRLNDFDYNSLNREIGEELRDETLDRFEKEKDPDGQPWKKSIRVKEKGGQTLSDKGLLKNSLKYKSTGEGVALGTNKIYAAIHQHGGTIKPKKARRLVFNTSRRKQVKKKVEIPKRSYLGVSNDNFEEIMNIVEDHVRESIDD